MRFPQFPQIYYAPIIILIFLISCQPAIQIDKNKTSEYFNFSNELVAFKANKKVANSKSIDFSTVLKNLNNDKNIVLYEFNSKNKNWNEIPIEIDYKNKTISANFNTQSDYIAINKISNELADKYQLIYELSQLNNFTLNPNICDYILCANNTFTMESFKNKFPSIQPHLDQLSFQDLDFNFPSIPTPSFPSPSIPDNTSICDQCEGTGGLIPFNPEENVGPYGSCNLYKWLKKNNRIRNAIIWRDTLDHKYDRWTIQQKRDLSRAFYKIKNDEDLNLPAEPDHTNYFTTSRQFFATDLNPNLAWTYYVNYLAHTLYLEICKKVDWSFTRYNDENLAHLLDSKHMFRYIKKRDAYAIISATGSYICQGAAVPGSPDRIYDFLISENIIANDQIGTVGNILEWCRDNMVHFAGDWQPNNHIDHWGYDGWPPVETVIKGSTHPQWGKNNWTAGCWGTAGFLKSIFKLINIPVEVNLVCNHAIPSFPSIDKYLTHGDYPYNQITIEANETGENMLIDRTKYNEWFESGFEISCDNIGRRAND